VYDKYAVRDIQFSKFKISFAGWSEPYGFLSIDMTRKLKEGKYRNAIDHFLFVV